MASNGRVVRDNVKLAKHKARSHCSGLNVCGRTLLWLLLVFCRRDRCQLTKLQERQSTTAASLNHTVLPRITDISLRASEFPILRRSGENTSKTEQ